MIVSPLFFLTRSASRPNLMQLAVFFKSSLAEQYAIDKACWSQFSTGTDCNPFTVCNIPVAGEYVQLQYSPSV